MSPCSRCVCVCVACTCVPGAAVRVSQAPESEWVILSVRARAMQGSSKNQETEGGPGPREKLEGSMKEGCVREFVKGGVCERQGQRETLAPSVREDPLYPVCWPGWLPKTQPRVPPLLEPPDTLSPPPATAPSTWSVCDGGDVLCLCWLPDAQNVAPVTEELHFQLHFSSIHLHFDGHLCRVALCRTGGLTHPPSSS